MASLFGRLFGPRTVPDRAAVSALYEQALAAAGKCDLPGALALFDRLLALDSAHADALYKRGNVLKDMNQLGAALASYDQAIAARPDFTYAHCNRGVLLHRLGHLDRALASLDRASELDANDALTHYNRALVLQDLCRWEDAAASYDRAVAANPQYAEAQYNRSLAQLYLGRFEAGWRGYEWRWKHAERLKIGSVRNFTKPLWLGSESIEGKRLLLHAEGGFGDTIQFCRYATLAAARGATVYLEVQPELVELLGAVAGVSDVIGAGNTLPEFDYHAPLMSLPLAFGTTVHTVPCPQGYLSANPSLIAEWRQRLGPRTAPRIGLAWSGNPSNWIDARRSIPLRELAALLVPTFSYFSLQRGVRPGDSPFLESLNIRQVDDTLLGFASTAALCQCLDLCICVDTSLAHLSGALGQKTWVLLPHAPDWRWLQKREDSPWYASARLYRQQAAGDWPDVLARARADMSLIR